MDELKKDWGIVLAEELFSQKFWDWEVGSPATLKPDVSYTDIWQWIKQQIKQAQIDENERLIKIIKECGTWSQTSMGFTVNDFETRIEELKTK